MIPSHCGGFVVPANLMSAHKTRSSVRGMYSSQMKLAPDLKNTKSVQSCGVRVSTVNSLFDVSGLHGGGGGLFTVTCVYTSLYIGHGDGCNRRYRPTESRAILSHIDSLEYCIVDSYTRSDGRDGGCGCGSSCFHVDCCEDIDSAGCHDGEGCHPDGGS